MPAVVTYRAVAFALGGLGLLAFAGAAVWALAAQPDTACTDLQCKRDSLLRKEVPIAVLAGLGALLMGIAVAFLALQMRGGRKRPAPADGRGPATAPPRSHGPIVTTTRPRPPRP